MIGIMLTYINPIEKTIHLSSDNYLFVFSENDCTLNFIATQNIRATIVMIGIQTHAKINFKQGENCELQINTITSGKHSKIAFNSLIDGSNSSSTSHHHIFLQENSDITFDGSVVLGKNISKSAGYLYEHSIILGKNIKISTKPNLDVYSNDIKAGHGATIQKFDRKELFYPMSRGLSLEQSKKLLIEGIITKSIGILGEKPELHPLIYQLSELILGQTQAPTNRSHLLSALGVSQNNSEND